ncbi:MAG: hypothetical protein ACD_61C00304G0006 [uncultured bacterium]|nr:MAG: hypothetical protein ACD_61C00304G0006 [uncultured bacterium]
MIIVYLFWFGIDVLIIDCLIRGVRWKGDLGFYLFSFIVGEMVFYGTFEILSFSEDSANRLVADFLAAKVIDVSVDNVRLGVDVRGSGESRWNGENHGLFGNVFVRFETGNVDLPGVSRFGGYVRGDVFYREGVFLALTHDFAGKRKRDRSLVQAFDHIGNHRCPFVKDPDVFDLGFVYAKSKIGGINHREVVYLIDDKLNVSLPGIFHLVIDLVACIEFGERGNLFGDIQETNS